ncbi:MAG: hypothetical protein IJ767_03670 [Bacteroidaceae bacterium]|nr:hypothetical protein [Bacteroidaceae bacterium]
MIHRFKITLIFATMIIAGITLMQSCEKIDEVPQINEGYETNYRMPDPTYLSDEDRQVVSDQEDEYDENAH